MDIPSFYFGTGVALLLALLAWGDQIRRQGEEVLQLENEFIAYLKKKKSDLLPLLRDPSKYSFAQQISSAINFLTDKQIDDKELDLHKNIKNLQKESDSLKRLFTIKYYLVVVMTISSFVFGIISKVSGAIICCKLWNCELTIDRCLFLVFLLFVICITAILIASSEKEKIFVQNLHSALDRLG